MNAWWLSSRRMTISVIVKQGTVISGPPIVRKFIGRPLDNLRHWVQEQGGYMEFEYEQTDAD